MKISENNTTIVLIAFLLEKDMAIFVPLNHTNLIDMEITAILLFGMPGGWELLIIVLVILLLFGAKRIPELARGLGRGIREFKDATKEIGNEIEGGIKEEQKDNKAAK